MTRNFVDVFFFTMAIELKQFVSAGDFSFHFGGQDCFRTGTPGMCYWWGRGNITGYTPLCHWLHCSWDNHSAVPEKWWIIYCRRDVKRPRPDIHSCGDEDRRNFRYRSVSDIATKPLVWRSPALSYKSFDWLRSWHGTHRISINLNFHW